MQTQSTENLQNCNNPKTNEYIDIIHELIQEQEHLLN